MKRQYKILITVFSVVTVLLLSCLGVSAEVIPSTTEIGVYYYPLIQDSVADEINDKTVSGWDAATAGNGQIYFDPNFVKGETQKYDDVNYKPLLYYEALGVKVYLRVTSEGESRDGLEGAEITLEFDDPYVFKSDSLYTVSLRIGSGIGPSYNEENPLRAARIILADDNSNTGDVSVYNEATPITKNVHQVTNFTFTQKQVSTLDNISQVRFQYLFDHAIDDNLQCVWFSYYMRIEQTSEEIVAAKQSTGILGNKIDQSTNIIKGHIDDATSEIMGGIEDSTNEIKGEIQEGTNQIVGEIQDSTDKITGEIQDSTDTIVNGWTPDPERPSGSETVDDYHSAESELLSSSADGIDQANSMFSGLGANLERYSGSFLAISAFVDNLIGDVPILSVLLWVSLTIGLFGLIFNLGQTLVSRFSNGKSGKRGG